MPQEKVLRITF